ncbi:MAG: lamin tail domain-containing protein [Cyclobacteriaceae bacterium]|nr:lamin tail domain-containing protein [Cyclobacteriaceae bacterium]
MNFLMYRMLRLVLMCCSIGLVLISSCSKEDEPNVENEDIFINEIHASGPDWIELYNAADETKNIGGYFIYDDVLKKYALPANTSIPAKGYLVLNCDDSGTGLNTNFRLSSTGETVYLETSSGKLIDKVTFPALRDGQSYGRYPDGSSFLSVSGNTSQGAANGDTQAPAIASTTRTPLVPGLADAVTVQVGMVSNAGVNAVKLFYRLTSGTFTEVTMTLSAGFYNGVIPAQGTTGKVDYYIEASNTSGKSTRAPSNPSNTYSYLLNTDVLPSLFINEFMAYNTSCCPDTDGGTNEYDDWIEIYNAGAQPVNIGGMYLSDNKSNPFNYKIPTDNPTATTIPAGGFILLWADGTPTQGPLHLDFALSNAGEDIGIYYIDGREINAYTFGAQSENVSWGRTLNGGNTWKAFATPTPKASNN